MISPMVGEMTVAMIEGSSTVCVVEEVVAAEATMTTRAVVTAEATTTTGVVVEAEAKETHDVAEASGQGSGSLGHRSGKEIAIDVPPGPQGVVVTESDGEDYVNFFSEFFSSASIVGTSAFRSRNRAPHPKDLPNRGNIFDDECLEKVWWNRV